MSGSRSSPSPRARRPPRSARWVGTAGGSGAIRSHRRHVRERISEGIEANPAIQDRAPATRPVVHHLPRALDLGSRGPSACWRAPSSELTAHLTWEYGYPRMPKRLADKYAYAEIVGPQGPVHAERVILGLVLFAPNTTYPQHHHRGIEESYVSILDEPCLLAYAWVGPPERLAAPEMSFSPRRSQ